MNESRMRDALLASEQPNPELEQRYHERLRALTERRITTSERVGLVIGLLLAAGVAAWFVRLMVTCPPDRKPFGLLVLAVGIVLCAGWAAYAIVVLRRGTQDLQRDSSMLGNLVMLSTAGMVPLLYWASIHQADPALGNRKLLVALLAWTLAGLPYYVLHVVREHSLKLRTDLLRLELAIAERDAERNAERGARS